MRNLTRSILRVFWINTKRGKYLITYLRQSGIVDLAYRYWNINLL